MKGRTIRQIKAPCEKGKTLFDTAWAAPVEDYALLYTDSLEHIRSCDLCING